MILIVGARVFISAVWPEPGPIIHTERKSGIHVTLIVIAPTSRPPDEMITIVKDATAAVGQATQNSGMYFSTLGVSDDWSVARGLDLLNSFGSFDEVIVGRNWFNSGIMMFVDNLEGPTVVPQIVVVRQEKTIREGPWGYGPMVELARAAGLDQMSDWAARGFPLEAGEPSANYDISTTGSTSRTPLGEIGVGVGQWVPYATGGHFPNPRGGSVFGGGATHAVGRTEGGAVVRGEKCHHSGRQDRHRRIWCTAALNVLVRWRVAFRRLDAPGPGLESSGLLASCRLQVPD